MLPESARASSEGLYHLIMEAAAASWSSPIRVPPPSVAGRDGLQHQHQQQQQQQQQQQRGPLHDTTSAGGFNQIRASTGATILSGHAQQTPAALGRSADGTSAINGLNFEVASPSVSIIVIEQALRELDDKIHLRKQAVEEIKNKPSRRSRWYQGSNTSGASSQASASFKENVDHQTSIQLSGSFNTSTSSSTVSPNLDVVSIIGDFSRNLKPQRSTTPTPMAGRNTGGVGGGIALGDHHSTRPSSVPAAMSYAASEAATAAIDSRHTPQSSTATSTASHMTVESQQSVVSLLDMTSPMKSSEKSRRILALEQRLLELEKECKISRKRAALFEKELNRVEAAKKQVDDDLTEERDEANLLRWQLQSKSAKMAELENKLAAEREKSANAKQLLLAANHDNAVHSSPGQQNEVRLEGKYNELFQETVVLNQRMAAMSHDLDKANADRARLEGVEKQWRHEAARRDTEIQSLLEELTRKEDLIAQMHRSNALVIQSQNLNHNALNDNDVEMARQRFSEQFAAMWERKANRQLLKNAFQTFRVAAVTRKLDIAKQNESRQSQSLEAQVRSLKSQLQLQLQSQVSQRSHVLKDPPQLQPPCRPNVVYNNEYDTVTGGTKPPVRLVKKSRVSNLVILAGLQSTILLLLALSSYVFFVDYPSRVATLAASAIGSYGK